MDQVYRSCWTDAEPARRPSETGGLSAMYSRLSSTLWPPRTNMLCRSDRFISE